MATAEPDDDRREYRRVRAPIYCRPARRRLPRRPVINVGMGGMRVYSDEPFDIGARFDIDLFLPDGTSVSCLAEVVWITEIGEPAKFDVGLKFLSIPEETERRLKEILVEE